MSADSINDVSELYAPGPAQYGSAEVAGVVSLVIAGILSIVAVVPALYGVLKWLRPKFASTRILPFFVSLLVANILQAIGTIMNASWVRERNVLPGSLCSAQAGIKQAGNVGMALWCRNNGHVPIPGAYG
ncbi:uncharacterized protein BXZ73DRAFT_78674 [Epithele typhae]|uniref:uncharacterized protein n=1 Tax=Epithele typhae TaxID=378194 RepID=UPI0020080EA3|nr:uncharacterized protein BXZ73DRAFT_78674 [Epithele typhae]KAH9926571.1 hypothetical protein BXZ73DRAFT_78674 [Epithele typhae]